MTIRTPPRTSTKRVSAGDVIDLEEGVAVPLKKPREGLTKEERRAILEKEGAERTRRRIEKEDAKERRAEERKRKAEAKAAVLKEKALKVLGMQPSPDGAPTAGAPSPLPPLPKLNVKPPKTKPKQPEPGAPSSSGGVASAAPKRGTAQRSRRRTGVPKVSLSTWKLVTLTQCVCSLI
jgi:hypothetical protein